MTAARYFPSRRDGWLGLMMWSIFPAVLVLMVWLAITIPPEGRLMLILTGVLPAALSLGLVAWIWFGTGYTVTEKELLVRAAFLSHRIPLSEVTRVRPTRNPLSSPALSLDRLEVRWGKGRMVMISPADRDEFLRLLRERCPKAEIRG